MSDAHEYIWCRRHGIVHLRFHMVMDSSGADTCGEMDWAPALIVPLPAEEPAPGHKRVVRVLLYEGRADWVDASTSEKERGAFVTGERSPFETPAGSITEIASQEVG